MEFRLRTDLKRSTINGFALPLGIEAVDLTPPTQGYTVSYTVGQGDEPDTYAYQIVVSHERVGAITRRVFDLLPDEICAIVEADSCDAYRSVDVYLSTDTLSRDQFVEGWSRFEEYLLEDASLGAGANSEEPFVEIFLDQWKSLYIHVPLPLRERVDELLSGFDLEEVPETWDDATVSGRTSSYVRTVLDKETGDVDELLYQLRHAWNLELNIDPDSNIDEGGRPLGLTLWHAIVLASDGVQNSDKGAYLSIWGSAGSLAEIERLVNETISAQDRWNFHEIYMIDRVAFDERPDELDQLPPRPLEPAIHLVETEEWDSDNGTEDA